MGIKPFDINIMPTNPHAPKDEFPLMYTTSINEINYTTDYVTNEYVPSYIINLHHLGYKDIIKNLSIEKYNIFDKNPPKTSEIMDGDEFIITYNANNPYTSSWVNNPGYCNNYYKHDENNSIASGIWKISIKLNPETNKHQAEIAWKSPADEMFSTDDSGDLHWLKLVQIIARNVNYAINVASNRAGDYQDQLGRDIPAHDIDKEVNNIYKYIAFDQCRQLNNVAICDYAKINLEACGKKMTLKDNMITAFCDTFNRAHFVRLLYLCEEQPEGQKINKISIYANTTFSYKNYPAKHNAITNNTKNNNVLSDEAPHTVLIKYTKSPKNGPK
jgi:hypothetical protein